MPGEDERTALRTPGKEGDHLASGSKIGAYEITGILGRGGMGEVYRGEHGQLQRSVAVKALPPEMVLDPMRRERLLREAQASSALDHPGIVTVYDFFSEGDRDFIVMELVEGTTLGKILEFETLEPERAIAYARQIADALAAAHAAGIVHRDLKPDNVMVTPEGRIKLMDFGLAKLGPEGEVGSEALTQLGTVLGTSGYMSPEQAQGQEVGPASDVFSLGIVLYEMLARRHPFHGDSMVETLHRVCFTTPSFEDDLGDLPTEMRELVARCLDKRPEDRPTIAQVLAALRRLETDASVAERPAAPPPFQHRRLRWAGLAAAAVAVGALVWVLWEGPHAADPTAVETAPPAARLEPVAGETPWELTQGGFALLERHYRRGNRDRAIAAFQAALEMDEEFATAYAGLAWAHFLRAAERSDPQTREIALQNAREAVRLSPDLAIGHLFLGAILTSQGETEEARGALEEALVLDPESAGAHRELGILLLKEGETDRALSELETALEAAPDDWFNHLSAGVALYEAARYEEAEAAFERASQLAPDSWEPFRNLAAAYQKQGRYDEAAAALQKSLKHRPQPSVYTNLGNIYYFQGLYQKSASAFEKSVELGPNNYLRWANLGDAYRRISGREAEAAESYERAIQLLGPLLEETPDDVTLRSRRALYLAQQGRRNEALEEAERSLALAGDSASARYRLLLAFEIAGARERALETLDTALEAGYPLDQIKREPELESLQQDVRFHRLLLKWE